MTDHVNTRAAGDGGDASQVRQRPKRAMLTDDVYDVIKQGLLVRRFAPGERLNLDRIARELRVSNTPVRRALARLGSEGLVAQEPYRGFRASFLLDSESIAELYEFRLFVEPPTAANAARRADPATVEAMLAGCGPALRITREAGADSLPQGDVDFHTAIAGMAGNQVVTGLLERTYARMRLYTVYDQPQAAEQATAEHQLIAKAIQAGDPDGAEAAMCAHLTSALERMQHAFD